MTHRYVLTIELLESTALTDGSSDAGGGHTTLDHISGTALLGAFVTALGIAPGDPLFARMFLSSSTRFLNAYPESMSADGPARSLPRPMTFRMGKLNRTTVHDSIDSLGRSVDLGEIRARFQRDGLADTPKPVRVSFASESAPQQAVQPARVEQVHVGIDRVTRAAADGVLFTYEAIRGGSRFHAAIETEDDEVAAQFARHRSLELRLGRSRSAGYGRAKATVEKAPTDWREYTPHAGSPGTDAIVTLLSDYVPHLEGHPTTAICNELARLAGIASSQIAVIAADTRQVRGFRGVWGLPRPSRTALSKGATLRIQGAVERERLADMTARGIGARTNEGFGRVAINWAVHGQSRSGAQTQATTDRARLAHRPESAGTQAMVRVIESRRNDRRSRQFVDAALCHAKVASAANALVRLPSSQLGNLRAAVSGTMTPGEIGAWFKSLAEKTAGQRWRKIDVPSLAAGSPVRNGQAFVWESLFGGRCSPSDQLEGEIGAAQWRAAVEQIAKLADRSELADAARAEPETALRCFIAGLCCDVSRRRNTRSTTEESR